MRRSVAPLGALVALLLITASPSADAAVHVIPPGQEDLMASMLGREAWLPGECVFAGASILQSRVRANYRCGADAREIVVELRHPDEGRGVIATTFFTISKVVGEPPAGLLDAIAMRIRASESRWKWTRLGDDSSSSAATKALERTAVPAGTHWLLPLAALLLVGATVRARPGIPRADLALAAGVGVLALGLRMLLGPWGPFRINALGPMWLDGAISDPAQLYGYGPGYPEVFSLVARLSPSSPDMAIFAANGILSALVAPLAFGVARLAGLDRTRAMIAAAIVAIDPVALRVGTTESYTPLISALTLLGTLAVAASAYRASRRDWPRAVGLIIAAGLLVSQSVRVHPVAWIPAALVPLITLTADEAVTLRKRVLFAVIGLATVGTIAALTSGSIVLRQLGLVGQGEVMAPSRAALYWWLPIVAAALIFASFRWARPRWVMVPAVLQLAALTATRHDFGQSFVWQQSYDRLYLVIAVIAALAFVRPSSVSRRSVRLGLGAVGLVVLVASWPFLRERTTDHREYRWVRAALRDAPRDCLVAYVGQVGDRNMMLPIFGPPALPALKPIRLDDSQAPAVARQLRGSPCAYYVRTSLCSSAQGRPVCDRVETQLDLVTVATARFPPVPSNRYVGYDQDPVESILYRVSAVRE